MKSINNIKNLSLTASTALALCVASGAALASDTNPFGVNALSQGYQIAMDDTKAAEGTCGGAKAKPKTDEGKCGGAKAKAKTDEGKCGASKDKSKVKKEGKCGEAKCGANKHK